MKISEMTMEELAVWCRMTPDDPRMPLLPSAWEFSVQHIADYTGRSKTDLDCHASLTFAAIALASDYIANPSLHVDNDKLNKIVESIIGLHDFNLLPGGAPEP